MHWVPWISCDSWDGATTRWFDWRRLNRYDIDGHHKRSRIVLGKPRFRQGLREVIEDIRGRG